MAPQPGRVREHHWIGHGPGARRAERIAVSACTVGTLAGKHFGHAYQSAAQSCWATFATCKMAGETGPPSTGRTRQQRPAQEGWRFVAQTRHNSARTESPSQGALWKKWYNGVKTWRSRDHGSVTTGRGLDLEMLGHLARDPTLHWTFPPK